MTETQKLSGRVALVTGAGKRLGRHIALRLAREGADIAAHYGKSAAEAQQVVAEVEALGRRAASFPAELLDVVALRSLVEQVVAHFGRLDILINSAANFLQGKFGEIPESAWSASLDTNLKAPFFLSQAAAPHLAKSGRGAIINFTDIGGLVGWREFIPHSISKTGIIMMTRVLAKELGPAVRVNALAPGTITMPGDPPEWRQDFVEHAALRRSGRPEEITDAIMFLLTADFVTGHTLVIDGGRTL